MIGLLVIAFRLKNQHSEVNPTPQAHASSRSDRSGSSPRPTHALVGSQPTTIADTDLQAMIIARWPAIHPDLAARDASVVEIHQNPSRNGIPLRWSGNSMEEKRPGPFQAINVRKLPKTSWKAVRSRTMRKQPSFYFPRQSPTRSPNSPTKQKDPTDFSAGSFEIERFKGILEGIAEHLHGFSGAVGVTPLVVIP
jgi:hypothetical protein